MEQAQIIQEILPKVNDVLTYSQHVEFQHTEDLLNKWYEAKASIMKKFLHNEMIYTHPEKVSFELSEYSKTDRYNAFIEYVVNLLNLTYGDELVRYLEALQPDEFYENSLNRDYYITDSKKIQKGTKIIKSFKYFITDEKLLSDIQNRASNLIQENKVEGYLCFSVHPLDFLSSSENTFNWRSCHALDGEYRAGNLSYMLDSSTIVCYLRSEQDVVLPRFPESVPWNNKKWRCLLFTSDANASLFSGRQYPFFSPGALNIVREAFVKMMRDDTERTNHPWNYVDPERLYSHWHNDYLNTFNYEEYNCEDEGYIEEDKYFVMCGQVFNIQDVVKDAPNSRHFNDLLRSSCYTKPYYMFEKRYWTLTDVQYTIGSEVKCLCCGEKAVQSGDTMMCPECTCQYGDNVDPEEYPTCDCCGSRFWAPEGWWVGDDFVCQACYDSECFRCERCGENCYNDEKHYDENTKLFICNECYNEVEE